MMNSVTYAGSSSQRCEGLPDQISVVESMPLPPGLVIPCRERVVGVVSQVGTLRVHRGRIPPPDHPAPVRSPGVAVNLL